VHYRPPTPEDRARATAALKALLAGEAPDLTALPLRSRTGLDNAGHRFTLLADAPATTLQAVLLASLVPLPATPDPHGHGWGLLALHACPTLLIEVPHPGSDRFTARLGLDLFHAIPTAALLVAGAHRRHADVAHDPGSLFHTFAQTLAIPELQLHGFAAASAPNTDAVLTAGVGTPTDLHRRLAKTLAHQGFRVRRHEHLAGRTNVQGIAAAARGTPFLHLELAPLVRSHRRARVVETVTDAWHQQGH
jgi:hypothetical protein